MYEILYKFIDLVFIPIDFLFNLKIPYDGIEGGIRDTISIGDFACIIVIIACFINFVLEITVHYRNEVDV